MKSTVRLVAGPGGFAEDKDYAREVRLRRVLHALAVDSEIVLDFVDVRFTTQSFVHALIGEALRKYGDSALERISFHRCSPQVRDVVSLVIDYSLGGFPKNTIDDEVVRPVAQSSHKKPRQQARTPAKR